MKTTRPALAKTSIGAATTPQLLTTVAFLKARFDERADHLDMFVPLAIDVVESMAGESFTAVDVQGALLAKHGLAMPQHTVGTLLKRAARRGTHVTREHGRYAAVRGPRVREGGVTAEVSRIQSAHRELASALRVHAARRKLEVESDDHALVLILSFLEKQQVGLLLDGPAALPDEESLVARELGVVAEFVRQTIERDEVLRRTIKDILEGLVLYHAAFMPDLSAAKKQFANLRAYFDSGIVRQALGFEGDELRKLARETLDLLKASGIQCLVFDETVSEIRRILSMYEKKLATSALRQTLRPNPMSRFFLTRRFAPSDVVEMISLLEVNVRNAGFQIVATPEHVADLTLTEAKLASALASPDNGGEESPRVRHDVDCVAGILTLRRGRRSIKLEDVGAVFVSSNALVIKCVRSWYKEEQESAGVAPMVHVRALSNLAWLKRPPSDTDFKLHEAVALCSAALRPSPKTWKRFLDHLEMLRKSKAITSDEAAAIVISDLSDRLLSESELNEDHNDVADAHTLDDVVTRVKSHYAAEASQMVIAAVADRDAAVGAVRREEAERAAARAEHTDAELAAVRDSESQWARTAREASLSLSNLEFQWQGRAQRFAKAIMTVAYWLVSAVILTGGVAVAVGHERHDAWWGRLIAFAIWAFIAAELLGLLHHLDGSKTRLESMLERRLRRWFL